MILADSENHYADAHSDLKIDFAILPILDKIFSAQHRLTANNGLYAKNCYFRDQVKIN